MNNLKIYALGLFCLLHVSIQNAHQFQGHYGCWWDVHYKIDTSKSGKVSSIEQVNFESVELGNFISSIRDRIVPLSLDYIQLPFILPKTEKGDYLLMHIGINIIMKGDDQTDQLHPLKKCDLEVMMDYDALQKWKQEYEQFMSNVSMILSEACDELEQLLKKYENILLLEENRPAITFNIDVTLDQDMIDSITAHMTERS